MLKPCNSVKYPSHLLGINYAQRNITESAQKYLAGLLEKQNCEGIGIRMFVSDPGTPKAETCIAYSRPGEHNEEDLVVEYDAFQWLLRTAQHSLFSMKPR